jgi:hypothetical protein
MAAYAFACGPLTVSTILLFNSYVPQSIDKFFSIFFHISPSLVMYTNRHIGGEACAIFPETKAFGAFIWNAVLLYGVWYTVYYVKVYVSAWKDVYELKYATGYSFVETIRGTRL